MREYFERWSCRRLEMEAAGAMKTARDEVTRLNLHAMPYVGDIRLAELRPTHVRDMMDCLRGSHLSPRSQLHVYSTLSTMLRRAMRDELLTMNPCCLDRHELPKKVDARAGWREDAVFSRDEVAQLISDPRIPEDRRVVYGLLCLAGMRIGEVIALRWFDWQAREPLDRLLVQRSYDTKHRAESTTKTKVSREVPVHPTLAVLLHEWRRAGWRRRLGRDPVEQDILCPQPFDRGKGRRLGGPRQHWSADCFRKRCYRDLEVLGLRRRSPHDGRATFITLVVEDGGRGELLERVTHAPVERSARDGYFRPSWPALCAELAKLRVELPGPARGGLRLVGGAPAA